MIELIEQGPPLTNLDLRGANFDDEAGEKICRLLEKSITSLKGIFLTGHPAWFDTDKKCLDWASVIKRQNSLTELNLQNCKVSESD